MFDERGAASPAAGRVPRMVGRGPGPVRDQRVRRHPRLPARRRSGRGTWQVVLGPYTVAPQGLSWEVEVDPRRGPARAGLRPRPGARAGGRPGPRLVPGGPAPAHRPLRRPPHPGRAGRGGPGGRAGLRRLHRAQHLQRQPGLGPPRGPGPARARRPGGHHPRRPLAGPRPAGRGRWSTGATGPPTAGSAGPCRGCTTGAGWPSPPTRSARSSAAPGSSATQGLDAVEVWNGPWTPDDEAALGAWDRMLAPRPRRPVPARGGRQRRPRRATTGSACPTTSCWPTGWTGGRSWPAWPGAVLAGLLGSGRPAP